MRSSFFLLALAAANGVVAMRTPSTNYIDRAADVGSYLNALVPTAEDVLLNQIAGPSIGADPGVATALIPEDGRPDYLIYWLLMLAGNTNVALRAIVDALIKTQHVVSPAGNVFTDGLEEALFGLKIAKITNPDYRVGSLAADGPPLRALVHEIWRALWYRGGTSVLNFDPKLGCDAATFQPCSDRALSSFKVVGDAFKGLFPINKQLPPNQSPYFGFFLEDKLYGGHVQYFASFNVAEQIFDALITWDIIGELEVTGISLKFFQQLDRGIKIGTYPKHSRTYKNLTTALEWAENTLLLLSKRTPDDLVLPLMTDKTTGLPVPPRGALRSQVAVLGAQNAYKGVIPPSWAHGGPGSKKRPKKASGFAGVHGCYSDPDVESQFNFGV